MGSVEKSFRGTIHDAGEITATIEFDPADASHSTLITIVKSGATATWKLVWADAGAGQFTFSGFVTRFEPSGMQVEENVVAEITVKLTGAITFTP